MVLTEFEALLGRLVHSKPVSKEAYECLKARLADLAHGYCGSLIDVADRQAFKELFDRYAKLKENKDLVISRPDKGSGVVLLNTKDYVDKMMTILKDTSKFKCLGPVEAFDRTRKVEEDLRDDLKELQEEGKITNAIVESVWPIGSLRPRMYGLPKVHKANVPLRPILAMIKSPQHNLAKWLNGLLAPVLEKYSTYCVQDSFNFVDQIRSRNMDMANTFWCSFDVKSLFTSIPLDEAIKICEEALFEDNAVMCGGFDRPTFVKLMETATSSVEFSFNGVMYQQTDGVAMGSPLGPTLANIFLGHYEKKILEDANAPRFYCRYVDDTFAAFDCEEDCDGFETKLNSLHPALKFTSEKERQNKLNFLDVEVSKEDQQVSTDVYRKPTFTGLSMKWSSYSPSSVKIRLIATLVDRAVKICSNNKLEGELDRLRGFFQENGFPRGIVQATITRKLESLTQDVIFGPEKRTVVVKLPTWGNHLQIMVRRSQLLWRGVIRQ